MPTEYEFVKIARAEVARLGLDWDELWESHYRSDLYKERYAVYKALYFAGATRSMIQHVTGVRSNTLRIAMKSMGLGGANITRQEDTE
jgi:hypothetical protein